MRAGPPSPDTLCKGPSLEGLVSTYQYVTSYTSSMVVRQPQSMTVKNEKQVVHRGLGMATPPGSWSRTGQGQLAFGILCGPSPWDKGFVSLFIHKKQKRKGGRGKTPGEPNDD